MQQIQSVPLQLGRIQQRALVVGVLALIVTVAGAFISSRQQFFQSYLLGYLFWVHVALGCVAVVMVHHLVGGAWGFGIRRFLESGAMTLPLMALLFVPLIFGLGQLYLWAQPDQVAQFELLQHKAAYLNVPFFIGRTALYFVIWIGLAYLLNRWSLQQDKTGEPALNNRLKSLSAGGLILYVLTVSFASFDWMMSLEPKWFSSIYGVLFIAGQALVTVALAIILMSVIGKSEPLAHWTSAARYNDLGNFLLAFVSFWAYIAFSQFLIIWSANLPEEIPWYISRTNGGWQWVALGLILFHFSLPFALLLSRRVKRQAQILTGIAVFVVLMRLVDLFWLVAPAFHAGQIHVHWLDVAAPIGIGGIWIAFFIWQLKGKSLLPLHDPRFQEVSPHD
ncbi:MAG: hypothetical protein AB1801_17930 [Chloroflexota bacterium]